MVTDLMKPEFKEGCGCPSDSTQYCLYTANSLSSQGTGKNPPELNAEVAPISSLQSLSRVHQMCIKPTS